MRTTPLSPLCEDLFAQKEHICFGVSPFNSYFSEEKILELAIWGSQNFKKMHFFVPDLPSAYTFEALGYKPEEAARKARKQGLYTTNKIYKALESLGYSHSEILNSILNWESLSQNQIYLKYSQRVQKIFDTNPEAREYCLDASRWVLEKRIPASEMTREKLEFAVKYFLSEIPLFTHTAEIIAAKSSIFGYHQCIDFLFHLYQRKLPFEVSNDQGFLVLEASDQAIQQAAYY